MGKSFKNLYFNVSVQGKKESLGKERRSPCQGKKEPLCKERRSPWPRKEGVSVQGKEEPLTKVQRSFLSRNRGHYLINEVTEGKAQGPTVPVVN